MNKLYIPLIFLFIISIILFQFLQNQPDTISFVDAVRKWSGETDAQDRLFRLTKPIALFIPYLLYQIGIAVEYSLLFQQWFVYFINGFLVFKIYTLLSKNEEQAYFATLLYFSCQPMALYGTAMLVDGLGWCAGFVGIYWILKIAKRCIYRTLELFLLGIYLGASVFIKESAMVAGAFLFVLILLNKELKLSQKLNIYLSVGIGFISIILLLFYITNTFFNTNLVAWIQFNHTDAPNFNIFAFILQTYRILDVYWVLVLIGFLFCIKKWSNCTNIQLSFLLTGIIGILLYPFVWKYMFDRILFMFAPFFIYLASYSYFVFKQHYYILIILGTILNLGVTYLIYKHQIPNLLLIANCIFIISLIILKQRKIRIVQ